MKEESINRIAILLTEWTETLARNIDAMIPVTDPFEQIILDLHRKNFQLWNTEDSARRRDVDDSVIVNAKRTIDQYNQQRNDCIERIDEWLLEKFYHHLLHTDLPLRTESPGSSLDRLSILFLKLFHMELQTIRTDVDKEHRDRCLEKVRTLTLQKSNLIQSIKNYFAELDQQKVRMIVYRQFKMYNDPALNPQLYGAKR